MFVELSKYLVTLCNSPVDVLLCFLLCSVVGPAITFRIRPNSKNLTAGDVAEKAGKNPVTHVVLSIGSSRHTFHTLFRNVSVLFSCFISAVAEKNFLESETGLKIEQAGVGEVYDTRINMDPLSSCGKFPL